LARTPRTWTGARTPSGLTRVRNAARRAEILGPRRSAAKTMVKNAIDAATTPVAGLDPQVALAEAMSALDRAAKTGAIHPNAAARRKSRLALKVNDLLGGTAAVAAGKAKSVGRTAAQKAAKARIAAGKAGKAKGAQTAAGKARAALSKTSRAESGAEGETLKVGKPVAAMAAKPAPKAAATAAAKKAAPAKATAKAAAKPAAKATAKAAPKKASKG
jgi:ribosomal protein S20